MISIKQAVEALKDHCEARLNIGSDGTYFCECEFCTEGECNLMQYEPLDW